MSLTDLPAGDECFDLEQIEAILFSGESGAADQLERHLGRCERCTRLADSINFDSDVLSGLRRQDLPPAPSHQELDDVVARVVRLSLATNAPATSNRPEFELPKILGPYRLVELLGKGGMGVVYRADDTTLQRPVAVKVARGSDSHSRARFLDEARALAAVRHDNIVTVHFVGEEQTADGPVPYMAMELLHGQTLHDWMRTVSNPPVEWILKIGRQIAAGLIFVHDAGMVHRDVKPGNLWLEAPLGDHKGQATTTAASTVPFGRIKLLDFGLAHQPGTRLLSGAAGTPSYAAPEQSQGAVDARADLFSFGCILYELCTGRLPFEHRTDFRSGWDITPPTITSLNPAVQEDVAHLVGRLLALQVSDRPGSARDVDEELARLQESFTGDLSEPVLRTPAGPGPAVTQPRRAVRLAGGFAIAAVLIALTAALFPGSSFQRPPNDTPVRPVMNSENAVGDQGVSLVKGEILSDDWRRGVQALTPQRQLNEVLGALGNLNPGYDWLNGSGWVEPYGAIRITIDADSVSDLRPVAVLKTLYVVRCRGSQPGRGTITDLSPLSGLKLKELHCRNNPALRDLSPIQPESLEFLDASYTTVNSLTPLASAPLVTLKIADTPVTDLRPLQYMPKLRTLYCTGCEITDFSPLIGTSLKMLEADLNEQRDQAAIRQIRTLELINGRPASSYWTASAPP